MNRIALFLGNVFKNPSGNWDFGRFGAFHVITAFSFGWLYALIWLHKVPVWSDLGLGYGAVTGGAVALIGFKDIAVAKANATSAAAPCDPQ